MVDAQIQANSIFEIIGKNVFTDSQLVQDIKTSRTSSLAEGDRYWCGKKYAHILRYYNERKSSCLMSSV